MQLHDVKVVIGAMYVAGIGAAGLAGGVASVAGWFTVGSLALLPALALMALWNHPPQTLAEAIQVARR
jgi:hypothetical protein